MIFGCLLKSVTDFILKQTFTQNTSMDVVQGKEEPAFCRCQWLFTPSNYRETANVGTNIDL